jgi:phenylalanyl-tRNA synthetase alpha chain
MQPFPSRSFTGARADNLGINRDDWSNVPPQILEKMGRRLHLTPQHPLSILRQRIHRSGL